MIQGYDFKMLSDGESLVFTDPNRDVTIVANGFFVRSMSTSVEHSIIEASSIGDAYRHMSPGLMTTNLSFELAINGRIEYKHGGIIRSIFDLYSIRDLLSQVEKKVNRRS